MASLATIARPYARAAFEYARDSKALDGWSAQLALLAAVVVHADIANILARPKVTRQEKAELLISIGDKKLDDKVKNFIHLLAENGRLAVLPDISREFELFKAEQEGSIEATVAAAQKIDSAQLKSITAALETRLGKKVSLTTEIDESLIGGAIIKAGDLVIDGSVRNRLEKLSSALMR